MQNRDMVATKPFLLTRLHSARDLSPSQRRIADCLLANMTEAALWGVEELAERSGTCVATVVRFAKKLEYSGYLEMRKALVGAAKRHHRRGDQLFQAPTKASATLVEVARRDIRNIERVVQAVDERNLNAAVKRLVASRTRLVIGDGISSLMARWLAYLLVSTGLPVMEGNATDFATQVSTLDAGDVLVAISIPPYTRETVDAAAYARKHNVPVLAFTDKLDSPLAKLAQAVLLIPGDNLLYSHSLASFGVVAHALATSIASQDPQDTLRKLREIERVTSAKFTEG